MMLAERLNKLFGADRPQRLSGSIIGRAQGGVYTIRTSSGMIIRAEGGEEYNQGERVTVLEGRILGRTGGGGARVVSV